MPRKKQVTEFADLLGVKVFSPGKHNGKDFSDGIMQRMVKDSNESFPYLMECAEKGEYEGNPQIDLQGKPIPGIINLNHQEILPETIKNAIKNVKASLYTKLIDGVRWVVADLKDVPNDIAKFLKEKHFLRSVELMPRHYNPKLQRIVDYAVRSIGFLDPSMPPAVKGQANDFVVQFSDDDNRIITVYLDVNAESGNREDTNIEEKYTMADKDVKQAPEVSVPVSVENYAEQIAELRAEVKTERENRTKLELQLADERNTREKQEIENFCDALCLKHKASQAFVGMVKPILEKADNSQILNFGENDKKPLRQAIAEFAVSVIENIASLVVPMGEEAPGSKAPLRSSMSKQTKQMAAIDEFKQQAQSEGLSDKKEIFLKAYDLATAKYPGLFEE